MDLTGWMDQWNMFPPPGGVILCAVSGGRDSMCLLHYLHQLSLERDFRVAAAALNHGLRRTAERDETLVRTFCDEREIPFDRKRFSPHITLIRKASGKLPGILLRPASMTVSAVSLMRSDRGKKGMIYTELGAVEAQRLIDA